MGTSCLGAEGWGYSCSADAVGLSRIIPSCAQITHGIRSLPASFLHVLIFSQHCSSPSGSFCFSPPLPLLLLIFLCPLGSGFPQSSFISISALIAVYTTNAMISPPIPRTLFLPSLPSPAPPSAAPAVVQWHEAGMSPLTTLTSPSQSLASSLSALSLVNSSNFFFT